MKKPNSTPLKLSPLKGREVMANFEGGKITSDAGIVFISELDKKLKITKKLSHRDSYYFS